MKESFLFRDSPPLPIEVVSSKGNYLFDKNGKKYLDFTMGWCVGNAGWGKKEIRAAVKKFTGPEYVSPTYQYARWEVLAEKLVSLLPSKDYTCFKATGGTEAVEVALKTAKAFNHRNKFIAFKEAYHGQSFACMSLVKLADHEKHFGPFSENFIQINAGDWEKTTQTTVELIEKKNICAFICEPIICNLGVVVPPKSFFQRCTKFVKKLILFLLLTKLLLGLGELGSVLVLSTTTLNQI
ncbi:MAG: aminotransferase class III-fold pyridoxal phosphate-dependent enzyme [archaeon]|jgi:acetylornithine/succinyldiaminopimelate/putrescine aminotransferase